jgi:hypothetical protein
MRVGGAAVACVDVDHRRGDMAGRMSDRRRDLLGWIVTPVVTLVLAPALAAALATVLVVTDSLLATPPACDVDPSANRCEETTFALLGAHVAGFAGLWALLWVRPWWRGLRTVRIVVAVLAADCAAAADLTVHSHRT